MEDISLIKLVNFYFNITVKAAFKKKLPAKEVY